MHCIVGPYIFTLMFHLNAQDNDDSV